jgi:Spy/CpxP family protein refolding chaperone
MKKQILTFIASGAMAAGMAFAQAAPAAPAPGTQSSTTTRGTHRNFVKQRRARIAQELNLTAAQKAQAKTIFSQARETAKPVREQLMTNRRALRAAVKADNSSEIQKFATVQGTLIGKISTIHSEAAAKFYQVLTPEQRAKSDQLHAQFRQRMHERFSQKSNG